MRLMNPNYLLPENLQDVEDENTCCLIKEQMTPEKVRWQKFSVLGLGRERRDFSDWNIWHLKKQTNKERVMKQQ